MSVMAKKTSRKFFLFGRYSLALLIPKKWLNELNVKRGDVVGLEFDRKRRRIVLRITDQISSFGDKTETERSKSETLLTKNNEEGLEPIPQID